MNLDDYSISSSTTRSWAGGRLKENKKYQEVVSNVFYLSIYGWLLYIIFSLNGITIANCCFTVIGNSPYFERFCNDFPFGSQEEDPMTYRIIPRVLRQSKQLVIKASRERD